jgi:hypothetical protein
MQKKPAECWFHDGIIPLDITNAYTGRTVDKIKYG